jgi:hypothetical protein
LRRSILLLGILVTLAGCQNYEKGLEQTVARADETSAIALLHAIALAERTYSLTNSGDYGTLQQLADGGFLDARYTGEKPLKDYAVALVVSPKQPGTPEGSYICNADPQKSGDRVGRHFYIDSSSTYVHYNDTQPATATDKIVE